ncbi:hypothetical protein E0H22_16035 [Rhodopseudomonas boonkerdii]|uniref:hypothetical protein n=1 Tax=Rhodopseudomonas boonkerdii TaxID=475937 RepID=UPI001E52BEB6|nr:hypothetical protein [Rhodopseudomonas boonkerdii]UGV27062.1 hypothetical protein E0H22_16035 [Rhodopseudomonas boonkerdii]
MLRATPHASGAYRRSPAHAGRATLDSNLPCVTTNIEVRRVTIRSMQTPMSLPSSNRDDMIA